MPTSKQARSLETQSSLISAAEKLIASHGLNNVTVRAIVAAAGQKNESALQYHFKNRAGLINAIHRRRNLEVQKKREQLCDKLLASTRKPALREICKLMIEPSFSLAQSDHGFRTYILAFGQEIAVSGSPVKANLPGANERGTRITRELLRAALVHFDDEIFEQRFDSAVRFAGLSMSRHARSEHPFEGRAAKLFFLNLIDAMAGLLVAEVSDETKRQLKVSK